ncbi:uncharacterized protein BDZ99DRAFT_526180 [Mytilinidion resinicola]|uniref:Uncharacterized protein n=1 Tax=Mytilinidion resinicola TaxID=574789 RepID=A0A6A6Y4W4_9PEZI|nr:uncharacterized protein BDZ99DRAFT_526180 [Mytilinidion resinicola]KAF2803700.1 hypothetical protein BDZ99DRAFT_526180 [Mytilinidion resinicola]
MNNQGNAQQTNASGNEDYVDKGLDAVEKKFGGAYGADPGKNRGVNEKIVGCSFPRLTLPRSETSFADMVLETDGARGLFEKATGKKVPDKFSN